MTYKKQFNKRKTGAQPTMPREAFDSLQKHQSQRTCHISREVIDADLISLRLFAQRDKLLQQETCRV